MIKQIIKSIITPILVSILVVTLFLTVNSKDFGGQYNNLKDTFNDGIVVGDQDVTNKTVAITAGNNQTSWRNTTGKTVYATDIRMGYESGTASSTWNFYVGTSTASTFSNYARPSNTFLPIDGYVGATGTPKVIVTATSTTNGVKEVIPVLNNEYLIFNVQETYACKSIGACETATSTNRGVNTFIGAFRIESTP